MRYCLAVCAARAARSVTFWRAFLAAFSLVGPLSLARADFTWTGDVEPSDPPTWDSSTTGCVGYTAGGTLTVDGDSSLLSYEGCIGCSNSLGHEGSDSITNH
jgi:hypothetical protein